MTLPNVSAQSNFLTLYELGLFIGVVGTLVLNIATLVKTRADVRSQATKDSTDEVAASEINVKTTLSLLPPLRQRIKELEVQVAELEKQIIELEGEVGRLTVEKNSLQNSVMTMNIEVTTLQNEKAEVQKQYETACDEVKKMYSEIKKMKKGGEE